jgi:3-oxoacyl-[acyl-carrier protein] reductase
MPPLRVALTTGGAGGLGREICRSLSRRGFAVVVGFFSAGEEAAALVKELGGESIALQADVTAAAEVAEMAAAVERRFGRLDAVVNNAGIAADALLLRQSEEEWDRIIAANLTGPFHVIRAVAPLMSSSGGGQIINISSYAGARGKAGQAAYSASKAALLGLTKTAAVELAVHNIRVNALLPGYMPTGMGTAAAKAMERAAADSLLGCLADPAEAAEMVALIASSGRITGQVIPVDSRIG